MVLDTMVMNKSGEIKMGAPAWKLQNVVVISGSGDGDYLTLAAAFAGEGEYTTFLLDAETFTESNLTLKDNCTLAGMGRGGGGSQIAWDAGETPGDPILSTGVGCHVESIKLTASSPNSGGSFAAIECTGGADFVEVGISVTNDATPGSICYGIYVHSGTTKHFDCDYDATGDDLAAGIAVAAVTGRAYVLGGTISGDGDDAEWGIYCVSGGVIATWNEPVIVNGIGGVISTRSGQYNDGTAMYMGDEKLYLDEDGDSSISAVATDDEIVLEVGGSDEGVLVSGGFGSDTFAFAVKNTSGVTTVAGDVGYINEAGEYKETTTAYNLVSWCVVLVGGANNADIYVARRGRVLVTLNGNCSAGDYLYTSTSSGQAQPQSYVRPEIFAVALTANAGGAGGTCEALLLTERQVTPASSPNFMYACSASASLDFISTIATLPGGAVLTYGAVSSGSETTITPWSALGTMEVKLVLTNTTRGTTALISGNVTATNTITLTANVPGDWQVGDTISARGQTINNAFSTGYFYEWDFSWMVAKPALAVAALLHVSLEDTSTTARAASSWHPYEPYVGPKNKQFWTQAGNVASTRFISQMSVELRQERFGFAMAASAGGATTTFFWNLAGWTVATP